MKTKPVVLVIDDLKTAFDTLMENVMKYQAGRLANEFDFVYLDSYRTLSDWYSKNQGGFVSLIVMDIDFTHLTEERKILTGTDVWGSRAPKTFDNKSLQGFLIYGKMRQEQIDRVVPVFFISSRIGLDTTKDFAEFLVYPGYGVCSFLPETAFGEEFYPQIVKSIDAFALRPLSPEKKREWRIYHQTIVGQARKMAYLVYEVERIAPSDATVILIGEPGAGKELVAQAIHKKSYRYDPELKEKATPLTINIAALDKNLIEDELFGHERGAFTGAISQREGIFEAATGSTVFLDEIGDLNSEIQIKLLRAMEYKRIKRLGSSHEIEVDFRIIAATNRPIAELHTRLRQDFYSRLIQHCVIVPSLADRWQTENSEIVKNDLRELLNFFVERMNENPRNIEKLTVSESVLEFIAGLTEEYIQGGNDLFVGNIRTLRNLIERAYERAQYDGSRQINLGHIISTLGMIRYLERTKEEIPKSIEELLGTLRVTEIEKRAIIEALQKTKYNRAKAAEILGIHRDTLKNKIEEYKIPIVDR